ncbi:hypothetical protein [Nocardia sp. NPDC003963]
MQVRAIQNSKVLRPSRLNAAGWCINCLGRHCDNARCIAWYARAVWETCGRCGGSEYVNGHVDPVTASERCDCTQGLIEAEFSKPVPEVVKLNRAWSFEPVPAPVVYESWPAGGGAPVRWMGR